LDPTGASLKKLEIFRGGGRVYQDVYGFGVWNGRVRINYPSAIMVMDSEQ